MAAIVVIAAFFMRKKGGRQHERILELYSICICGYWRMARLVSGRM